MVGNWIVILKGRKPDPISYHIQKISSKSVENLNVWPETVKLKNENTGKMLQNIAVNKDFLSGKGPQAQEMKAKID